MFYTFDVNSLKTTFLSFWVILKNLSDSCKVLEPFILDLCLRNLQHGNHIIVTAFSLDSSIRKMFSIQTNAKFQLIRFEELRFQDDGLGCTVVLKCLYGQQGFSSYGSSILCKKVF